MRKNSENSQKLHYKMYKKGRFWLFAGVLVMTTWQGNQAIAHADTATAASSSDESSAVTSNTAQ